MLIPLLSLEHAEALEEEEEGWGWCDGDFSLGYIALQMPLKQSSRDVQEEVGSMGLEFRREACAGAVNMDVTPTRTGAQPEVRRRARDRIWGNDTGRVQR